MINFGEVPAGAVLPIPFAAYAASTGASVTLTGLAVTDIEVYKGTSMTQRASDAGYSLMDTDGIDLDGITGIHGFSIDTGDNTDSGFYSVGSYFTVVVSAVTIDSQTVNFIAATFRLKAAEASAGYPVSTLKVGTGTGEVNVASGVVPANMTQISGDSAAADALEAAYDDTAGPVPSAGIVDQGTAQAATGTTLQLRSAAAFADDELIGSVIVITGGSTGVGQARVVTDYVGATDTATVDAWTTTPTGTITYKIWAGPPADGTLAAMHTVLERLDDTLEDEAGTYRFTSLSLQQAPSGLDAAGVRSAIGMASADLDTQLDALLTISNKLDDTLEDDAGTFRFTTNALEQAPSGTGASAASIVAAMFTTDTGETEASAVAGSVVYEIVQNAGGGGGLDAAGVRAALGMASADLDTQLDAIKADTAATLIDTNELQGDWANGGRLDLILDARASQTSVDDLPTNAELATALGAADDAVLSAVAVVDANVDAIKAKTDSLTFTVAGAVDANVQRINDVTITGNGQSGTEFGV